uniref:Uncharacterized protein n=1 Tax=Oryza sativa subsp. japonica TaxID=39947 RepID=Q6YWF8_ORYSJ|nr:hypothetical protein [Oryza sativa Japonica Group]
MREKKREEIGRRRKNKKREEIGRGRARTRVGEGRGARGGGKDCSKGGRAWGREGGF